MKKGYKNELIGIILFGFGVYVTYVLYKGLIPNQVGFIGKYMYSGLVLLLGRMSYVLPLLLFIYSVFFIFQKNVKMNKVKLISILLSFFLIASGFILAKIDVGVPREQILKEILRQGGSKESGGMVGSVIALALFTMFGKTGSLIIVFTVILVSASFFASGIIKESLKKNKENKTDIKKEKNVKKGIGRFSKNKSKLKKESKKEIYDDKPLEAEVIDPENNLNIENEEQVIPEFEDDSKKKSDKESIVIEPDKQERDNNNHNHISQIFISKEIDDEKKQESLRKVNEKGIRLEEVMAEYGIEIKVINAIVGPVITRYEISVAKGIRVNKIVALSNDIAMNLEAQSIRIEAPIPGKNAVGIEIPNDIKEDVYFSSIISSKEYKNMKSPLGIVLGKSIIGENVVIDLRKMPHLLIAGRTGAGKSVCINSLVTSIVTNSKAEDVKFIMIDPKMVELMPYNGIPHLLTPVIIDPKQAAIALKWAVNEMEIRYKLLSNTGARNIEGYNKIADGDKLDYIVIIIDELADLMMVAPGSIEESIARIAQKARAIGIHLVVATQRPSTDVITGTIKANLPSRISFAVASQIDSRTILDGQGAEKLLGRGDMLFLESGSPNLIRIQGAFISDEEVSKLTKFLSKQGKPKYNDEILVAQVDDDKDELFELIVEKIREEDKISTSFIQRKFKIGYARAARIVDQLLESGIINEDKEVLIDV